MEEPQDSATIPYSQFICIGTGFSGIGLGATLKRWYGITDVRFFEREADVGGTWYLNNYPGATSDVPNALYCFSFEQGITWTKLLPDRDELFSYLKTVANKYDIPARTTFRSLVQKCQWHEERQRWRVTVKNLNTGNVSLCESQFLFSACGILDQPNEPDLPGLSNFKGPVFHTARWRHDFDLQDKKVVVFGNGCTGTQLIPALAPQVCQVTQFVRSKHWIVPSIRDDTINWLKSVARSFPGGASLVRFIIYYGAEDDWTGTSMDKTGATWRAQKTAKLKRYIKRTAPEKYHDLLIPDFEFGCKRRVFNAGYLESLHRDNVEVTNERPAQVKSDHIVTSSGKIVKADAIVFANGFKTERVMHGIDVMGRTETLEEHWERLGGPGAYNTCALSGFPNFFILAGPNAATSHTSAVMAVENAINLALRQIKPVLAGRALAVEVTRTAEEEHVKQLQKDLSKRVWASGCNGWYVATDDEGNATWNSNLWPYSQARLWYRCLFPTKSHWKYTGVTSSRNWSLGLLLFGVLTAISVSLLVGRGTELSSLDTLQQWHRNWTSLTSRS